ncbi:MAG: beta-galactosidase [Clostridia bacterium]|nr:beta-galactosidase [Clostridia bacterium]
MSDPIYFGAAYYPEAWPESERPYDIKMMKEAGMNVMRFGEFAWHKMEPRPGEYDFKWLHEVVDDLAANGIKSVLGTPTATPPRWFLKAHPDAAKLHADGYRMPHGGRRHCCSNNPAYQEECNRIVEAMAKEFGDDPNVIAWQLDNEIYSFSTCTCPVCEEKFHRYLEQKYGTIDALNAAWNLELFSQAYDSFDDIPMPVHGWQSPHLKQEWMAFHYQSDIAFIHGHRDILAKYVKVPISTDQMPVNGMGYEEMTEPLDLVMFNHYNTKENIHALPFWFDHLRTLKDHPFWNTETATGWNGSESCVQVMKPFGFCRLNSWLPVALGGEANLYWLWRQHRAGHELIHGSVISAAGRPLPMFDEVQQLSREFAVAKDFLRETKVDTPIAFHFTSLGWQMMGIQPVVKGLGYESALKEYFYQPISDMGLRPDLIGARKDLSTYKVLFTPLLMSLEDGDLGDRIEEWVIHGGTWVVGPCTDIRTAIGTHYIDRAMGRLERMTGSKMLGAMPDGGTYVRSKWNDGEDFGANHWQEVYEPAEMVETLVSVTDGYESMKGGALLQKIHYGKGVIYLLGTLPSEADMKKIVRLVCADVGIAIPETSGRVLAIPRKGDHREGLILMETGNEPATYILNRAMTDILTGKTYQGTVELKPYDVLVLE